MLSDHQFDKYASSTKMSESGRQFVQAARSTVPAAAAKWHHRDNSIVFCTSKKMGGRQIPTRSRSLHASAVKWHEFNPSVVEFHTDVHTFDLTNRDEAGRARNRQPHRLQFLVLGAEAYLEDWREESDLLEAERKDAERFVKMGRYYRDDSGNWHDRAIEAKCESLGLKHRLRTSRDIPRIFLENMRMLDDYLDPRNPILSSGTQACLQSHVSNGPVRYLDILNRDGLTADALLSAIANGVVYVDLSTVHLRDTENLRLFRDEGMSRAYECLNENLADQPPPPLPGLGALELGMVVRHADQDWEIVHVRLDNQPEVLFRTREGHQMVKSRDETLRLVMAQSSQMQRQEILVAEKRRSIGDFSSASLKRAAEKLAAVRDGLPGFSAATMSRIRRVVRECSSSVEAIIALAPNHAAKGSRAPRLPLATEQLAKTIIEEFHNQPSARSGQRSYDMYVERSAVDGFVPMSYVTFLKRLREHESIHDRAGKRVAYRDSDIPLILDVREPIHGLFPHELLYIDHTLLNLMTAGPNREDWGKVWVSVGVDGHVPTARALYVSYAAPSALSALMVLRDYVRRWRRLPRVVVVDGGKEFRTGAFKLFCKIFGIEIRYRGPGRPRGGAPVERLFGMTEEELANGLQGNSIQLKEARMTTKSVQPNQYRIWTFPALCRALDHYLFKVKPADVHARLGVSPLEFEELRLQQTGRRDHIAVEYDENLLLLTCPTPPQPMHRVYPNRGIWESGWFFWHSDLSRFSGKKFEIRLEPWSANVIYVNTGQHWIVATARNVEPLLGHTRYEVAQAMSAQRRFGLQAAARERRKPERARRLAESRDPLIFDPEIAAKQRVTSEYYRTLGLTVAMFSEAPAMPDAVGLVRQAQAAAYQTCEADPQSIPNSQACDSTEVETANSIQQPSDDKWGEPDEETGLV